MDIYKNLLNDLYADMKKSLLSCPKLSRLSVKLLKT